MQYVKQAVEGAITLDMPVRVRENAMLMVYLTQRPMRAGRAGTFMVDTSQRAITLENGTKINEGGGSGRSTVAIGSSGRSGSGSNLRLPVGKHIATLDNDVRVGLSSQWVSRMNVFTTGSMTSMSGSLGGRTLSRQFQQFSTSSSNGFPGNLQSRAGNADADDADDAKPLAEWTFTLQAPFEVIAPGEALVELIKDDSLADQIRRAALVERCRVVQAGSMAMLDCALDLSGAPMPVAFDVVVRVPGDAAGNDKPREWLVGTAASSGDASIADLAGLNMRMMPSSGAARGFPYDVTTVDLVLRTNRRLAEDQGLGRAWDGEIVIKDVPIERIGPGAGARGRLRSGPV